MMLWYLRTDSKAVPFKAKVNRSFLRSRVKARH